MSAGWPFLVARGRTTDYRTVLVPDFLVGHRLQSLLADSLHAPDDRSLCRVIIPNAITGPLTISYRAEVLRPADMPAARHAHDAPAGATYLSDEHGRPLEYLYGLLQRGDGQPVPADADMDRARAAALDSYRALLLDEDSFTFERSEALPLAGLRLPDHVAADERQRSVTPATRLPYPRQPALVARGPAVAHRPAAKPSLARSRRGPRDGAYTSAVLAGALFLIVLTVAFVALLNQPAAVGRVIGVELRGIQQSADLSSCTAPLHGEVVARITVENAPVRLTFHLREDDRDGEEQILTIEQSGPTDIPLPVELDNATGQLSFIVQSPNRITSDPLPFNLECESSRSPRSSAPPTATAVRGGGEAAVTRTPNPRRHDVGRDGHTGAEDSAR